MLRTLLTLVARFDLSPRFEEAPLPAEEDGELDPEDFAREVMIELMRNTLDNLKDADTLREKTEVLTEIQKIMLQDARTKEVFRELDGFIMLMSLLSTLLVAQEGPIHEPEEQILLEVLESIRLVFMIVSDAIHDYPENTNTSRCDSIGFKSLFLAIRDLVSDKRTVDVTLGFLLSMTLNDFALSGLFTTLRSLSMDQVDAKIHEFETRLIIIRQPDAIRLLWDSAPRLVDGSPVMRYAIYKLFELFRSSVNTSLQLAKSRHEISRTLSILTDCIRNSWENSEDMERLRGYEILTDILRSKAQMINMTSFETLFESIGLNFRTPEQSTVVNVVLYKAIALDFEFWSHARREIQHVYFEHFITLLEVQVQGFQHEAAFIKAGLANSASSPHSIISRIDYSNAPQKAEQVLEIFVSLLSNLNFYNKFITALPVMRICLLLIGDRPQPFVATQVLRIIAISIRISVSFKRKFELISGWSVLKTALPECWDSAVNEAAFDVLLGRTPKSGKSRMDSENAVICPQIVPTILSALQTGLRSVVDNCGVSDEGGDGTFLLSSLHIGMFMSFVAADAPHFSRVAETTMERLVEDLLDLHASSATFKQIFRSQQTRRLFIESYRAFVTKLLQAPLVNQRSLRLLEKIAHLGISLAVDSAVAGAQKREIQAILQDAETPLNPSAEKTVISAELLYAYLPLYDPQESFHGPT
ncbi:hypothetical protein BDZ89DRAFT_1144797 [Hymenopellis radicata]|nr:hypothetical protein BDZ89DRAFT_1144797 [Hymenopellis radicata]